MRRGPTWAGFLGWMVGGAVLCLATLSLNLLAAVPAVIIVILAIVRPALFRSAFGLLSGVGVMLLFVAFLQRQGPGTVCWQTATAAGCDEYLDPMPWLLAGVVLLSAGLIAHSRRMRREREVTRPVG